MSLRDVPDFLKRGDPDLPICRPRYRAMRIGKGFPEARPVAEGGGDPQSERDWAVWKWVRRVG